MHLPVPGADPGGHLRPVPGGRRRTHRRRRPGQPAGHRDDDRRAGQRRPAREDPVLHRDRQGRGRQGAHRRRARRPRRRPVGRLLRRADDLRGRQLDADLPGGDLRPGRLGDDVRRLRRRDQDRQRHPLRPRRRRLDPRRQHRLPGRPRHRGRPGVDELLPPVPRARGVRRLQAVRHRPREPPDDARPLPADEEPAGQLQPAELGFF